MLFDFHIRTLSIIVCFCIYILPTIYPIYKIPILQMRLKFYWLRKIFNFKINIVKERVLSITCIKHTYLFEPKIFLLDSNWTLKPIATKQRNINDKRSMKIKLTIVILFVWKKIVTYLIKSFFRLTCMYCLVYRFLIVMHISS